MKHHKQRNATAKAQPSFPEQPKIALRKHISLKFCFHLLGHVTSVLITAAVLQLSIRHVHRSYNSVWDSRWYTLNLGKTEESNLLQLLAKIHELIMVASLYGIVLHFSRRLLTSVDGVPFGLLVGGYQPPGSYIVHTALWSPLLASFRSRTWRFTAFAFFLLFATIFANTLGPASAVALVPYLDWHAMRHPFLHITTRMIASHNLRFRNLSGEETIHAFYPTVLDRFVFEDDSHSNDCRTKDYIGADCPGTDHEEIRSWISTFTSERGNLKTPSMGDIGVGAYSHAATAINRSNSRGRIAIGTSLPFFVIRLLDQFWALVSLEGMKTVEPERQRLRIAPESPVLAPVVKTQCKLYEFESAKATNASIFFPTAWLDDPTGQPSPEKLWPVPQHIWDVDRKGYYDSYSWAPVPKDGRGLHERASIGVVLRLPGWSSHGFIMPCVIAAHWHRPEVIMDSTMNLIVESNFTAPGALEILSEPGVLGPVVRIEPEWADMGFFKTPKGKPQERPADTPSSPYDNLFLYIEALWTPLLRVSHTNGSIMDYCDFGPIKNYPGLGDFTRCDSMAMMLSLAFAKNMATVGLRSAVYRTMLASNDTRDALAVELSSSRVMPGGVGFNRSGAESPPPGLNITFETDRFGWGYGFQPSGNGTLIYAFSVLLVHSLLVIHYLVYLACFRCSKHGYLSSAWDDLAELLALGLASSEVTELGAVGAGVESSSTWNTHVAVRSQGRGGGKLDMVVERPGRGRGGRLLEVDKLYR